MAKWYQVMERTMNLSIICRYLNLIKSEDNCIYIVNRKFTSRYNIKIVNRLWKIFYIIFIELYMKRTFDHLEREITPVKCIILESRSEMSKWSVVPYCVYIPLMTIRMSNTLDITEQQSSILSPICTIWP